MSELKVTIPTDYGDIELPYAQAVSMGRCIEMLRFQGKQPTWHRAECDCCLVVHEFVGDDDHSLIDGGFVVGQDGGYDWVPMEKTEGTNGDSG